MDGGGGKKSKLVPGIYECTSLPEPDAIAREVGGWRGVAAQAEQMHRFN